MSKPLVFISHITDERQVALALKQLVNDAFMGMIEVFVSSDPSSLPMGNKWLTEITDALKRCAVEIVLASPQSVKRPWINFEAGAGWVRDVPVIPICHSGLEPATLPPPLRDLQAATATDDSQLSNVFRVLSKCLDCKYPDTDFTQFVSTVRAYERTSSRLNSARQDALVAEVDGLSSHAKACLIAAAERSNAPGASTWPHYVKALMDAAGYRDIATNLGIASLLRLGLLASEERPTGNFDEVDTALEVTHSGWAWLEEHADQIELRINTQAMSSGPETEEIPF